MVDPSPAVANTEEVSALHRRYAQLILASAHNMRSLLQSIQGQAESIEPGLPPAKLERQVHLLRRDALRLAAVVDDLSLRGELVGGPPRLCMQPCAIEAQLLDLTETLEAQLPDEVVAVDCPRDLPPVWADEERLRQALWRLLFSVACASKRRARPMRLMARLNGSHVEVRILIAARPLTPSQQRSISMPLIGKAHGTRRGRGMGLDPVRELLRRMGGDLHLGDTK
jgi:signal transduction histidine kinase